MAKRVRGSSTRPGQRARIQRSGPRPARPTPTVTTRPPTLTPEEEARAAELEAQIVAEERASDAELQRSRERTRRSSEGVTPVRTGSIASAAAHEYDYVARDVRRIAIVGGSMIGLLLGLWAVTQITGFTI
jgi:hypothetical protein